jgi:hypothetical protein
MISMAYCLRCETNLSLLLFFGFVCARSETTRPPSTAALVDANGLKGTSAKVAQKRT